MYDTYRSSAHLPSKTYPFIVVTPNRLLYHSKFTAAQTSLYFDLWRGDYVAVSFIDGHFFDLMVKKLIYSFVFDEVAVPYQFL